MPDIKPEAGKENNTMPDIKPKAGKENNTMPDIKSKNAKITNILENCKGYLENNIYAKMGGDTQTDDRYNYFSSFADASALVHNPTVQKFKIIEHYYNSESGKHNYNFMPKDYNYIDFIEFYFESRVEYFVIEKNNGILYGFAIFTDLKRNFALYHGFEESKLKNLLCHNSDYISKNIGEIATVYKIPYPYEIPPFYYRY